MMKNIQLSKFKKKKKFQVGGYIDYPANQFYTEIGDQIRNQVGNGRANASLIPYDFYTWDQLPIEQKSQIRGNIARSLISRPTPGNLYNALSVWAGWEDPENPHLNKGIPPNVGIKAPTGKVFRIPAFNPAEAQAARDFIKSEGKAFFENNPKVVIETTARPGVSEDWAYPYDVMVRHGLRKPITTEKPTITVTGKEEKPIIKLPEGKTGDYRKTYNRNRADDKENHIGRQERREFQEQKALSSDDPRTANNGRPREARIRDMFDHIQNYPRSVQKGLERVIKNVIKGAAKQGIVISPEKTFSDPRVKRYLKDQLEILEKGLLNQ